jgi:hypothetical protein
MSFCRGVAFLLICIDVASASNVDLGFFMKEIEFKRRSRTADRYADSQIDIQLRESSNFYTPDNQTVFRSLANYDPATLFESGTVFTVVIAHLLPWVKIEGLDSDLDPGNIDQTRTYSGGEISGLLIDYLEILAYNMDIYLEYVFPCKKIDIESKGFCGVNSWVHSLQVMQGNRSYYIPELGCSEKESHCFASNVQITSDKFVLFRFLFLLVGLFMIPLTCSFIKFHLTQPVLNEGWKIVVATQEVNIDFMSWLDPFDWSLWIVILAEIYIASLIFVLTEGYGTNENLWMDNIFSTCYDSFYW